jgi:murE/murF fusion protein
VKKNDNFEIYIKINNLKKYFLISNDFQNNVYNILAAIAVINIYINIFELNKNIFLNFEVPNGRGDFSKIKVNGKNINLIDESYNSNPLSLKSAILNYDKINSKKSKKYLLLGDMLELGNHSKKLHQSIIPIINQTKVDKVFVKGSKVTSIFNQLTKSKKGRILQNKSQIINLIRDDLNNNDYLMIKASNATGFNRIVKDLKGLN